MRKYTNKVSKGLKIFGIVELICSIICAFLYSGFFINGFGNLKWRFFIYPDKFVYWISIGIGCWIFFIIVAEIIQLLEDIKNKDKK